MHAAVFGTICNPPRMKGVVHFDTPPIHDTETGQRVASYGLILLGITKETFTR
jgi:hypothetical protein